jgi:hypothetical protein
VENTSVRTQYLAFLLKLPAEFSNLRADAARQTAKWLADHGDDTSILTMLLNLLSEIPADQTATGRWMAVDEWQQLASDSLNDVKDLTFPPDRKEPPQTLMRAFARLYLQLLWSLNQHDSKIARKVLIDSHYFAEQWFEANSHLGPPPYLPLPKEAAV